MTSDVSDSRVCRPAALLNRHPAPPYVLSPQVRLTLETAPPLPDQHSDTSSPRRTKSSPPVSQLVRLLWGEDTAELQMSIGHIPHVVMYLSLKLDSSSPQEEVSVLEMCVRVR